MTPAPIAIGTPEIPGSIMPGDDVCYLPDVTLYGTMEFKREVKGGYLLCRMDGGDHEVFQPAELSTPEAVAHAAAKTLG